LKQARPPTRAGDTTAATEKLTALWRRTILVRRKDHGRRVYEPVSDRAEDFAPGACWSGVGGHAHFVQFYEADAFLLNSLSGFIGTGLGAGEGCVVVAGKAHRDKLDERLQASGLDLTGARAKGQYVSLDAAETLATFMVDGRPEPMRFKRIIGDIVEQAARAGGGRVRVFGDMVAHLCSDGQHAAAVTLEELWNDLQRSHPFSLFCAYPLKNFDGHALTTSLADVCATHSAVIPAESYTELCSADDRLRVIIELQQKARTLEAEVAEHRQTEDRLRAVLEERERLLTREQAARAEAESANRLKDEFLATVSHELRTPLTAISGWTNILRSGQLDAQAAERALATIERNAILQAQLIDDLLDVSRIITGKLRLDVQRINPAAFIEAAIEALRPAAEARGVSVRKVIGAGVGDISGDPARLQQVVWNLLSNAIKFTPRGGSVEVVVEREGTNVLIAVSDTGEGIGPEFLPHVFERFRQADMSTTREHGGLGLGLAIVRHLVELHGGTVKAESNGPGSGSTFTVMIPLESPVNSKPILKTEQVFAP
jgi:signal transduction histidine kinase